MASDVATLTETDLEQYRVELRGHCYRMLGSAIDAEDAVQDTMARAWKSIDRFEGRSSVRTWMYRIATNVCLDLLAGRSRRARPMEIGHEGTEAGPLGAPLSESTWVEPYPDTRLISSEADPAERAAVKESIRLAFIAALQHLPPRQRAVLLLREVLRWKADEVAELLDTSVASINSALQRARATLAAADLDVVDTSADAVQLDAQAEALLQRYLDAFERYDMEALTVLLHEDATLSMPPFSLWMRGHDNIVGWMVGPGAECEGSRVVATRANGTIAFGQYRRTASGDGHEPWSLTVLEVRGDKVSAINAFLDTATLFPLFGLPSRLD